MPRITLFVVLLPVAAVLMACSPDATETPITTVPDPGTSAVFADTIFSGGPIVTVDDALGTVEALAIRNGRILATGSADELSDLTGPATEQVDLAGHTLAPGFIDGHAHVANFGMQAVGANLLAPPDGQVTNIDELVTTLQDWAANSSDDDRVGWIFGIGYDDSVLEEGRHPTREDLDLVSTDMPVIAIHISGHFATVNSKGLELIGYDADTPDPAGGIIRRQAGGREPNGVLEELAAIPVMMSVLTPGTSEDFEYFTQRGLELAMSFGYTTAQEGRAFASSHEALANYASTRGFPIDVVSYIDYTDTSPMDSAWNSREYQDGYRVGGVKITLDGSPQGRTAWRTEPYLLPPDGQPDDYLGYPAIEDDAVVMGVFDQAYEQGWQVLIHANGDAAIDQLIRAMGPSQERFGPGDRRHTLIHGQYIRMDQLDALQELELAASLFPMHTFYWGDWHSEIIGDDLARNISPTRAALDRGIPLTSHTDAPVALPNLMQVMWATVNRTTRSGRVLGAEQRLTPEEALKAITLWGAWQHFEEDEKGSITPGKIADLVVLSENPLTVDPARINEIIVLETIKEGRVVWRRDTEE